VKVILLFLDGVGMGENDPSRNPFFVAKLPVLRSLLDGELPHRRLKRISSEVAELFPVNTTLGMPGLPQSGTGQTAIFTGVNGAKKFGRHFGPFPPTALRPFIESKNIFRQLIDLRKSVSFANAFPKQFFDYTDSGTRRLTVTTLSCIKTGIPLLRTDDLRNDMAIAADLTRARWPEKGNPEIPVITPKVAGRHLWKIASKIDFTLFEYWITDHAGHSQDMVRSVRVLEMFDEFLGGMLEQFDSTQAQILIISDHGNIEDLSTKSHTRNPVPCIVIGKKRRTAVDEIRSLVDVTPFIVNLLR
jgi:2,3-bisphosphoglycerate-independent phosphoglycerate mutase